MLDSNVSVKVGDKFINNANGGQIATVLDVNFQGNEGVIEYKLHDSFRFSSKKHSNCDIESFRKTFSEIKGK